MFSCCVIMDLDQHCIMWAVKQTYVVSHIPLIRDGNFYFLYIISIILQLVSICQTKDDSYNIVVVPLASSETSDSEGISWLHALFPEVEK
jgi:hypothetical protein